MPQGRPSSRELRDGMGGGLDAANCVRGVERTCMVHGMYMAHSGLSVSNEALVSQFRLGF